MSNSYVEYFEKKIKKLENKKIEYENQVQRIKKNIKDNEENLNKVKFENSLLKDKYKSLVQTLKLNGAIIDVENKNYNINDWENLNLVKKGSYLSIKSKHSEIIHSFDETTSKVLNKLINNGYNFSVIAVRVNRKFIKIHIGIK